MAYYLAIDIGASSGRHIIGWLNGGKMQTEEVYRFENGVCDVNGKLTWNIKSLFDNVVEGIKAAFAKYPCISSLAIDTWGVDYVLINYDEEIMPCYSYRDGRTSSAVRRVHELVPFAELYARTGIQFQPFNTVYQLYDDSENGRLDNATEFLMIPEYLTYKLTGVKSHEYTNATTTGLINGATGKYDREIIRRLGLPDRIFFDPQQPRTAVGRLKPKIREYVGGDTDVVLCASHDTASAVEGIPMDGTQPYISSGTWSLLGVKLPAAITDENSRKANYSNEGGVGYVRYQKNIAGMWVVNRLRDELCPNKPWNEITAEASDSKFTAYVDINDGVFLSPTSMKTAFDGMLKQKPASVADYFNSAYISLAHGYARAIAELQA
ncbi:MAG: rhamnulokinase, partial [Clostridiales bacterium]|nr:rhamnulokinase [Clostridiales bacterium]